MRTVIFMKITRRSRNTLKANIAACAGRAPMRSFHRLTVGHAVSARGVPTRSPKPVPKMCSSSSPAWGWRAPYSIRQPPWRSVWCKIPVGLLRYRAPTIIGFMPATSNETPVSKVLPYFRYKIPRRLPTSCAASATVMNKPLAHPHSPPIFRAAEELGVPLGIHGAPSRGFGFDYFEDQGQVHALEHPFPLMIQFTSIICDGVLEKFPKLKIAFLEAGCGWLPYMMDRLDYEYETRGGRSFPNMKKKPSEYVKDCPVYVTCEPEETSLAFVTQVIGAERIMFPSDYPHERVYGEFLQ